MQSAIDFAYEKHFGQLDKSGKPYFGHALRVALDVIHFGEEFFIVALLHDTVEDCNVSLSYIAENWGQEIADAVASVSRIEHPVKEKYMELIHRASLNRIGREVKLADLDDNMRPERILSLPIEMQDIVKRYERAKKYLEDSKAKEEEIRRQKREIQVGIDGWG